MHNHISFHHLKIHDPVPDMPKRNFSTKIVKFCVEKNLGKLKQSVDENPDGVYKTDTNGNTILHIASEVLDNVEILEYLLRIMGSEYLEVRNKNGLTPFMIASGVSENRGNVKTLYRKEFRIFDCFL